MAQGTPSNCDAVAELIPGYALEALIQADQALVEGHVAGCPGCRAMLAEHRTVAEGLVYTPPLVAAPPHLEADLRRRLEQARAEAVTRTPFPLQAWLSRLLSPAARPALAVTALLVLSLVGSNLYWGWTTSGLRDHQAMLAEELHAVEMDEESLYEAVRVLTTGARTVVLPGGPAVPEAVGRLIEIADRPEAFLVVEDLPLPPTGKTYQLWFVHDGERENGGVLSLDAGLDIVVVQALRPLEDYEAISITVEPAGGSPGGPTGPLVMGGPLP